MKIYRIKNKFLTIKDLKYNKNKVNFYRNFSTINDRRRVVITGLGSVNPLGNNLKESWENLKNLKSGIRNLEEEEYGKDLPKNCKIGATIRSDFDGKDFKTLVRV
jgi:hypothetical protein